MALGVTTSGSAIAEGSSLTVEQVIKILVQPLQAASIFLSTPGLQIFDTDGSPVRVPKQAPPTDASLVFTGENVAIPEDDFQFGQLSLLPSTMKSVKTLTRFSNELARQSVVAVDQAIQSRLVTDVAARVDTALIASAVVDGTSPTGILTYPGTQVMAAVGTISVDTLYDAESLALIANVNADNLRWMMRPETWTRIRKLKTTQGDYLVQPNPTLGAPKQLLGYPVTITPRIPIATTTKALLWDPTQVAVARDMAPSVRVLTELYAAFDQQAVRVVARYDAGPLNAQAIVRLDAITL
jgi:HK97 family phage major capsid protein